ncbi:hypothetical protein J7L81_04320 [Candidatus Aerophobetes bacterium]|uniref:Uncharacterized protein n=1 Tax=Aerophobetes bacterium TaxID=2030807 RepID=A0A7V5HZY2_UNCAE|nr:hypothetical protein [Candidatus Aerophobetes bacterium]HHF99055.1 hypothetical protein [Candidatus Aerophobetes bacterium]
MAKRAQLPRANDVLIGIDPKEKERKTKIRKQKAKSIQISVHLSPETLKMIETAKLKLFTDYDIKLTRSEIIERIIKSTVSDEKKLIELLR